MFKGLEREKKMLHKGRLHSLTVAVLAALCVALLSFGCAAAGTEPDASDNATQAFSAGLSEVGTGVPYQGQLTMEELILYSDAVARVRFNSVRQTVEEIRLGYPSSDRYDALYANSLEFTFEVLEYLKGSGGAEVQVVVFDRDGWRHTREDVEALDEDLLPLRTTDWDEREAIVFLRSNSFVFSTVNDDDRYWLASFRNNGEDGYSVASEWSKSWLPDAEAPGAAGAGRSEQRFLLEAPGGASGQARNAQPETIAIGELKALISRLQAEVDAGDGTEDYHKCVIDKYRWERLLQHRKEYLEADPNRQFARQFDRQVGSGLPAGTDVYVGGQYLILDEEEVLLNKPPGADDWVVKTGQDADLFAKGWPLTAITARPLPAGEYRFYWAEQGYISALCDAIPEDHRTRDEVVVTVTPPPNTLHEAFFDPFSLTSGIGVDSSNGVLNPTSFSVDGTSTSITGLKWESGSVVLSLSPYSSLSGHKLDFIELDGSVSLSLAVSSATEDSTAGTLTWSVSDQPWHDGDLLMLRIATLTVTPDPTPIPTAEPTPIPTAGITVTLSPRPLIPTDYINLSIRWVDPASCDSRYFVGIYNSSGTTIYRFYGYHPAPDTTSLERELGLLWDRIADLDWLVRVSCVPASGDESLVGEAELRSGLPETP